MDILLQGEIDFMKGLIKKIEGFYKIILLVLTLAMFIIVGTNVFSRYVLNNSLGWADELARFIFIWVSFLGAVLAYAHNEHIGLDFIIDKLPSEKIKLAFRLISDLGILLVLSFLAYYGWTVAIAATNVSPALYIPMKIIYMVIPVSAVLMVLINISKFIQHAAQLKNELK